MHFLEFIIEWAPIPLQLWVLGLLIIKKLYRRFPIFLAYTSYVILIDLARVILVGKPAYFYIYWGTESVAVLGAILSIHESFLAVFGAFHRLGWFRFLWPCALAVIWIYCSIRAWIHPPPHFARAGAILISGAIASSFTILGLVLLFFLMAKLVVTTWYLYEFHIVYGFGISSVGMVGGVLLRSEFGTKFGWLTVWGPPLAYLLGVILWLSAFLRREPDIVVGKPAEALLQEMKEDLSIMERIQRALNRRHR